MEGDSELKKDILVNRRSYFEFKVKKPLMKSIVNLGKFGYIGAIWSAFQLIRLCMRYPEPTKENTTNPKTHILLDIFNEFFKWEDNKGRDALFKAIKRILLAEYEHDNYYQQRMDWFLDEWYKARLDGRWQPNPDWSPMMCWRDPATNEARVNAISDIFLKIGIESEKKKQLSEV